MNDEEVAAVVIDIASPGGYVGACLDMVLDVMRVSPKKILGFVGREAAVVHLRSRPPVTGSTRHRWPEWALVESCRPGWTLRLTTTRENWPTL